MELLERQEVWSITYNHALGETASWFYARIRDEAAIYGRRCAKTGRVMVPPRSFSDETLLPTTDWVKVGPGGRIEAFTMVYEKFNNLPEPPYAFGYVLLDGRRRTPQSGGVSGRESIWQDPHAAAEVLAIGTRVEAKFADQRKGDMLDFWFEIAKS